MTKYTASKNQNDENNNEAEVPTEAPQNPEQEPQAAESAEAQPNYEQIISELNDRLLRTAAEAQNLRRRAEQDIQKARHFSIESFARDLLGVVDNLYRATDSVSPEEAAQDEKLKSIRDGVEITQKEMSNVMERHSIKRIDPLGEPYDPNLHQALSQIEDAEKAPGTIVNVMQVGYLIKDRLLRPALVVVVK